MVRGSGGSASLTDRGASGAEGPAVGGGAEGRREELQVRGSGGDPPFTCHQ